MRAVAPIVAGVLFVWVSVRAEDAGTALLHAASWYPGAGNFRVQADVIAVTPGANGAAKVEFRTRTKDWEIISERGYTSSDRTEERPVQTLVWEWPEGAGPVPVVKGMVVYLDVSSSSEILRVSYTLEAFGAQRKMDDGRWEFIVIPGSAFRGKERRVLLLALPRAFQDAPTELRWTKPHGLLIASFEDGEYGALGDQELESVATREVGWPISNQPGTRVRLGRDGWQRWFDYFGQSTKGESNPRWLASEVPASQRLPAFTRP